ncbi:MAG: alcohol dehydrogenase catalytic domain-containing protein, partial [Phycisphaerales bacterium]|nr:alcohol dehydrogenase catalytic domain-containing protein [Phycisphaerales bacterium]
MKRPGSSMRALRYTGGTNVELTTVATPEPPPGEALIQPVRVGICATDLEIRRGYMGGHPITLGHEFVGRVLATNPLPAQAERYRKLTGKRVVGSINAVCGECDLCRSGLSTHCRNRTVLGISGRDGCFADAFCLPLVNLHEVPDSIDDDHAVFVEPLAAAIHGSQQIRMEGKPYITVLGDGRLGLLCAQVMQRMNASVRVIGMHAGKLALCERWGIKHRLLSDIGLRGDQDIVVDCTGSPRGFADALRLVRPRGVILLKSTFAPHPEVPVDPASIVINEIQVIGSR